MFVLSAAPSGKFKERFWGLYSYPSVTFAWKNVRSVFGIHLNIHTCLTSINIKNVFVFVLIGKCTLNFRTDWHQLMVKTVHAIPDRVTYMAVHTSLSTKTEKTKTSIIDHMWRNA